MIKELELIEGDRGDVVKALPIGVYSRWKCFAS